MRTGEMRVVGNLKQTPWQRFARLQRTVQKLARGHGQPKGVYRFKTHEEAEQWTEACRTK